MVVVVSLFFLVYFFCFRHEDLNQYDQLGERPICALSSTVDVLAGLSLFLIFFEARSTHLRRFLIDTRLPATMSVVLPSSHRKLWSCLSSEHGAWLSSARELCSLGRACGSRSTFSGHARWFLGFRTTDLLFGGCRWRRVSHTRRRLAKTASASLLPTWIGCFCQLCLCIPFVSPVQSAFVVPLFYGNICWLVARLTLFYFQSERYCKGRLKCYSCKICVSA
jgi:hypothetical protein